MVAGWRANAPRGFRPSLPLRVFVGPGAAATMYATPISPSTTVVKIRRVLLSIMAGCEGVFEGGFSRSRLTETQINQKVSQSVSLRPTPTIGA